MFELLWVIGALSTTLAYSSSDYDREHGGVKMGVVNNVCDNGQWNVDIDWDRRNNYEEACQRYEFVRPLYKGLPVTECLSKDDIPRPLHKCMTERIVYKDLPPRAGPHRPLWPVYGEYTYLPPQRWIHSLEHGAAVFLYHPCAHPQHIKVLKNIARSCLRKHIITPYRSLPGRKNFAVITYGCRLLLGRLEPEAIIDFVKMHALKAPEDTPKDGQYSLGLLHKAGLVTDIKDSGGVCPVPASDFKVKEDIEDIEQRLGRHVVM